MSTRYLSNIVLALVGGFLVVATQAFGTNVISWLAVGVAIAAIVLAVASQLDGSRGLAQRSLDLLVLALGAVTIVFSRVFGGTTVMWLSFAEALSFVGLAVTGLTLHEIENWRRQHDLAQLHGFSEPAWIERRQAASTPERAAA